MLVNCDQNCNHGVVANEAVGWSFGAAMHELDTCPYLNRIVASAHDWRHSAQFRMPLAQGHLRARLFWQ